MSTNASVSDTHGIYFKLPRSHRRLELGSGSPHRFVYKATAICLGDVLLTSLLRLN